MNRACLLVVLCWACDAARAGASPLALAQVTDGNGSSQVAALVTGRETPRLVLAQRAIDREWSVVGDSSAAGLHVEGLRSEIGAAAMSAALPGAGQVYAGEARGYAFAAAEVAGWLGYALLRRSGHELRGDARDLAGAPEDTASAWSFERWQAATGADASGLRALYSGDREAFFDAIGSDDRYVAGWSTAAARSRFGDLRDRSDQRLGGARWTAGGLWLNHLVAAVDALRAARFRNLDFHLAGDVELKAKGSWHRGQPGMMVSVQRRF